MAFRFYMARNTTSSSLHFREPRVESRVASTASSAAWRSNDDTHSDGFHSNTEQLSPRSMVKETKIREKRKNKASKLQRRKEIIQIRVNEFGQPKCEHACTLVTYIGVISRDGGLLPIDVLDWRKMPKEAIDEVWSRVLTRFSFPDENPRTRPWVILKADQCWREWKYMLRASYFDPHLPIEQQYERRDKDVHPPQWKALVDYWNTEVAKEASARNKRNRACLQINHCGGTRSRARLRQIEAEKREDHQEPNRVEIFRLSYTHHNGSWINQEANNKHTQMQQLIHDGENEEPLEPNEAFTRVMGPDTHGRVRGFGLGVTPVRHRGESSSAQAERAAMEQKIVEITKKLEARDQDIEQLKEQHQLEIERNRQEMEANRLELQATRTQISELYNMFANLKR